MFKIGLLLFVSVFFLSACSAKPDSFVRKNLVGEWRWDSEEGVCKLNSLAFSFSKDGRKLSAFSKKEISLGSDNVSNNVEYIIERESSHVLRLQGVGEERKTALGKPAAWDLVMKDGNRFCWRRTDWSQKACTRDMVKCH